MKHPMVAAKNETGQVLLCRNCSDVHVVLRDVSLRLSKEEFISLSELLKNALRHPSISLSHDNPKLFMAKQLFSVA